MCPKSTLYPLHYAFGGGGGLVKHSVLNMNAIVRAKCTKRECYSESKV